MPSPPQETASPSMMQERARRRASASTEAHMFVDFAGDHTEAVVLDLVQPLPAGGRLWG